MKRAGSVQIYREIDNSGEWKEMGTPIFGTTENELFGWDLSLSGDGSRLAVSSLGTATVHVFDFDAEAENWKEVSPSLVGVSEREFFGTSLQLSEDGSILVIGAPGYSKADGKEADVGIVRTYRFDTAQKEWVSHGQPLEGTNAFDAFGSAVALNSAGNIVAVGAPDNNDFCDKCGYIQVFENNYYDDEGEGSSWWNNTGSAIGMNDVDGGRFGTSVSLSGTGDRLVGGAPYTIQDGYWSKVGVAAVFDNTNDYSSTTKNVTN